MFVVLLSGGFVVLLSGGGWISTNGKSRWHSGGLAEKHYELTVNKESTKHHA